MTAYRHIVECRGCGARYWFDDRRKTPKGHTNTVPCANCKSEEPHTVIVVAEVRNIQLKDLLVCPKEEVRP